jgi:hypothetical protein
MKQTSLNKIADALNVAGINCEIIWDDSGNFQVWGTGEDSETQYLSGYMDIGDPEYWELFRTRKTTKYRQVGVNNIK